MILYYNKYINIKVAMGPIAGGGEAILCTTTKVGTGGVLLK